MQVYVLCGIYFDGLEKVAKQKVQAVYAYKEDAEYALEQKSGHKYFKWHIVEKKLIFDPPTKGNK